LHCSLNCFLKSPKVPFHHRQAQNNQLISQPASQSVSLS